MRRSSETTDKNVRALPSVNEVLDHVQVIPLIARLGRQTVLGWARDELDAVRRCLLAGEENGERPALLEQVTRSVARRAESADRTRIGRVVNATGVILHTGLGRAVLSRAATTALADAAGACNLEVDLEGNQRRYRGHQLQPMWQSLTGCEDSLVVNNNAAATLLTMISLAPGREILISRGQLIEIGGSFRLPEIFELSGARLREVGTTNRTRLSDYERAIGPETVAVMHVHPSNYRIVGFTSSPGIAELVELAHAHNLIAIDDIGSGSLVDVTRWGLPEEPAFGESIAADADVVLGSGDKLLGGPQAGIILGKKEFIDRLRKHPLARTVRVDKLTLGALSATLENYLKGSPERDIPTLAMLAAGVESLLQRANAIKEQLGGLDSLGVEVRQDMATVGGGSLPGVELPTAVLSLTHTRHSAEALAGKLRLGEIRLVCRIQQNEVLVDLRSVLPADDPIIAEALRSVAG